MFRSVMASRAGQSLVGILVVLAIIGLLVVIFFWGPGRRRSNGLPVVSTPKAAVQQAQGVQCAAQLQQVQQALQMAQSTEGQYPQSLTQLESYGVTATLLKCPESGQPYLYDPAQGKVWCPQHGG